MNRRMGASFLGVVLGFLVLGPSFGWADTASLQAAADAALPGQVLVVPSGDTQGPLVLRKPVVLKGAPGARLVRTPRAKGPTLWVQAPGTVVEDLEVDGSGAGDRRDHTGVLVTSRDVTLKNLVVLKAWAGVWIDKADGVHVDGLTVRGQSDHPFWQRGEGLRVTGTSRTALRNLDLADTFDGVYLESCQDVLVDRVSVTGARYGVHIMFGAVGSAARISTRQTVAGLMMMETTGWTVKGCTFTEGYRTGSGGIREVRTGGISIEDCLVSRQAGGIELIDARSGRFTANRIEENAVAWSWGGDNSGTLVTGNSIRGNLVDAAGTAPAPMIMSPAGGLSPGARAPDSVAPPTGAQVRPRFSANYWDAWNGLDTAYRYDPAAADRTVSRPWSGLFLGSPWSLLSQGLPGGEPLDVNPRRAGTD